MAGYILQENKVNTEPDSTVNNLTQHVQGSQQDSEGDCDKVMPDKKGVYVTINEGDLKAGFECPFTLHIEGDPGLKKGDLITAVVQGLNDIRSLTNSESVEKAYRRWICRLLNISDTAFDKKEDLVSEISKVESTLESLNDADVEYDVTNYEPSDADSFGGDYSG